MHQFLETCNRRKKRSIANEEYTTVSMNFRVFRGDEEG